MLPTSSSPLPLIHAVARRALASRHQLVLLAAALSLSACDVVLKRADSSHGDVEDEKEHISMPYELAAELGVLPSDTPKLPGYHRAQVRVTEGGEEALYTVSHVIPEGQATELAAYVSDDGADRLELSPSELSGAPAVAVGSALTSDDCPQQLSYGFVECLDGEEEAATIMNLPESYVFIAPHGGMIEEHTDVQAREARAHVFDDADDNQVDMQQLSMAWYCKGWREGGGAKKHWHITSTDIGRYSFPKLDLIGPKVDNLFNGFKYAVSFHGMSDTDRDPYSIYVGGGAPVCIRDYIVDELAAILANAPGDVDVRLAEGTPFPGSSAENVVNWLTHSGAGGIQLEQTILVREQYGTAIAERVAALLPNLYDDAGYP